MTQSMSFSPYKKAFEERIAKWESQLRTTQDVLDEWMLCQRQWLYLEPIFSSEDINRQLPVCTVAQWLDVGLTAGCHAFKATHNQHRHNGSIPV